MSESDPWGELNKAYAEYMLNYGKDECDVVVGSYLDKVRRVVADIVAEKIVEEMTKDGRPWYRLFEPKHRG